MTTSQRGTRLGAVMLTAALVSTTGCAVLTTQRLPAGYQRHESPRCTEAALPIAGDTALGLIFLAYTVATFTGRTNGADEFRTRDGALLGALSAASLASAGLGWSWRETCRVAREEHDAWLEGLVRLPGYPWDAPPSGQAAGGQR